MKRKTLYRILYSLIALIIIVLILLPGIVRRVTINNSKDWVGRKIELESLRINYFTATIRLLDFKLFEANENDVFVKFDTLIIDLEPWQLIQSELVIEQIYLSGLRTTIIQHDSTFNFSDLIEFHTTNKAETEEVTKDTSASSISLQLLNTELFNGELVFIDDEVSKPIAIKGIDLFIPYFGWKKDMNRESGLKFYFENGGYFNTLVDWNRTTGNLKAMVELERLDLNNFYQYSHKFVNLGSLEGVVNAKINISKPAESMESIKLSGLIDIIDFTTTSTDGDTLAGIKKLHCTLAEISPLQQKFIIDTLLLDTPKGLFEKYDSINTNFSNLLKVAKTDKNKTVNEESNTDTTKNTTQLFYALNTFRLRNGIFDFVDKTTDEPFKYHLSEISLDFDEINSNTNWLETTSQMKLNHRGNLKAEIKVDPMNPMEIELYYVITDFQLSDLNIYSTYYAGVPVLYGDMYYKSETTIHNGIIDSKNELVLRDVELGEQSGGIVDLPIKFALFILKDKNGNIVLDIPVEGNLNEPGMNIKAIVWDTFKGFIGKIAASPFKALGNMLGVDPNDIKEIEYNYLDTVLTEKKQKQLDLLLELESKKDGLDIELVYFNDLAKEKESVAIDLIGQKFNTKRRDYKKDKDRFAEYVHKKIKNDTMDIGRACMQLADEVEIDTLVKSFKRSRINSIKNYLVAHNDSTHIDFYIPKADAPKNIGSKPVFEIKYSVKSSEMGNEVSSNENK